MTLVVTGDARNVTSPLSATVTALANNGSGAIRVTTSAPHLFGNADLVKMQASPAVGNYYIAVIDGTHFDLVGSTFTTTGTGTVTDLSLTPQIQMPTDGDTFSLQLSGMLSSLQALADRTQYLAPRLGKYQLLNINSGNGGTLFTGAGNTSITNTGWTTMTGLSTVFTSATDLAIGDLLDISFDGSFNGTNGLNFATAVAINVAGGGLGSQMGIREASIDGVGSEAFLHNSSLYLAPGAGSYVLAVQARANGGSSTLQSVGDWTCIVRHWRPN